MKPTIPDDVEGHRRIVRDGGLPIATGENLHTLYEFKQRIVSGGVTFPEADVTNCGGVTAFLKIAHMAEAFNLPITSHGAHDITIHLLAALPNRSYLEVHGFGLERFLMSINVRYSAADGLLPGSTKPQARRQGPHRMSPALVGEADDGTRVVDPPSASLGLLPGITWRYRSYIVIPEIRKVRMTRRSREMDSKQFRARYVAISTPRPSWGRSTVGAAVLSEQPSASTN